jgi:hypothetical protein
MRVAGSALRMQGAPRLFNQPAYGSRPDIDRRGTQVALKHCRAILHQQGAERRDVAILKRVSSALCDHPLPKDH